MVYSDLGETNKAIEYLEKGLDIRKKTLPENNPDIALSYDYLASVYKSLGETNKYNRISVQEI